MAETLVADAKDASGRWLKSYSVDKHLYRTLSGRRWNALKKRCNRPWQERFPAYLGTSNGFKDFQSFVDWSIEQVGYANTDWHLDKDFLSESKIYSQDTCMFLPQTLNKFFNTRSNASGPHPLGVYELRGEYRARCHNGAGERVDLGTYKTPAEAFAVYKAFKESTAKRLASEWEGKVDSRATGVLRVYSLQNDKEFNG